MIKKEKAADVEVIAYRRVCVSAGENAGLSHYIFAAPERAAKAETTRQDDRNQ